MQVFLILFSVYFTVFQILKLFSYIELTLVIGLASRDLCVVPFISTCSHGEIYRHMLNVIQKYDKSLQGFDSARRATEAANKFSYYSVWVETSPVISYAFILERLQCLNLPNNRAIECVIIDDLLNMATDFHTSSYVQALEAILYLLKMVAKKFNIPVIVFAEYSISSVHNKLIESNYIDKIILVQTEDDRVEPSLTTVLPTIIIPSQKSPLNLFDAALNLSLGE